MSAQQQDYFEETKLTKLRRLPKRGVFDKETVYKILDEAMLCFIGFNIDRDDEQAEKHQPCVIPTLFGRKGDTLYIHGSSVSGMIKSLTSSDRIPICVTVALFDGLVLAKSAFHHSANYRSVVIYGSFQLIDQHNEKMEALEIISDHVIPNRWEHVKKPSNAELIATSVLKVKMEYVSGKQRKGPPGDDKKDLAMPIWSGVVPINKTLGPPQPDQYSKDLAIPECIRTFEFAKWGKTCKRKGNKTKYGLFAVGIAIGIAIGFKFRWYQ
eukprot:212774_1